MAGLVAGQARQRAATRPASPGTASADRAYDTDKFRAALVGKGIIAVIPPKANRVEPIQCDWATYKERHLVECFFSKIKQFRRVATRYDKTAAAFLAFVSLACLMVWLR